MRVSSGKSSRSRRFDCRSACAECSHERPESAWGHEANKLDLRISGLMMKFRLMSEFSRSCKAVVARIDGGAIAQRDHFVVGVEARMNLPLVAPDPRKGRARGAEAEELETVAS